MKVKCGWQILEAYVSSYLAVRCIRLVRPFVIHAFDARDCRLDRSWIESERDVVDPREKLNRNIFTGCVEHAGKLIAVKHFVILTDEHLNRFVILVQRRCAHLDHALVRT